MDPGAVLDILVQDRLNTTAAERFSKHLLAGPKYKPRRIVIDGLCSYGAARREVLPDVRHRTRRHLNNRAENSHRPTRRWERQIQRFFPSLRELPWASLVLRFDDSARKRPPTENAMLTFTQFGAGRIGAIHAANLAASGRARLKHVVGVNAAAAESLAARHGARASGTEVALADPEVGAAGDIDSAMVLLRRAGGRLAHINYSRRASYGYDQHIEVHRSLGRLIAGTRTPTTVELANANAVAADKPLHFFLKRYADAYRIELSAFLDAAADGTPMPVGAEDGRQALVLADAALRSLQEGRPVKLGE